MNDRYVLLTGARNNAGDYLIGHRARGLLTQYRPDRSLVEFDAWKPLTDEQLEVINGSRALLLTGGPALQRGFWPKVYPLTSDLNRIKVPIITFGVGWKSVAGDSRAVSDYEFSPQSLQLLERIAASGYVSSVRDYHTWEIVKRLGHNSFVMTGCPALYDPASFDTAVKATPNPASVVFSLGVECARSRRLLEQTRQIISGLVELFGTERLTVAFHHSLDERYSLAYGKHSKVSIMQRETAHWLESLGVTYVDVSGGLDAMLDLYGAADLHVGYRIHAHILMLSLSKSSLLISEDGRGIALRNVTGGLNFDAFTSVDTGLVTKVLKRLGLHHDQYRTDPALPSKVMTYLRSELEQPVLLNVPRQAINQHFPRMRSFLAALP